MSNTKDILIKLKDATINQALPLNDLPVEDIKEAIKAEYSISFGENSSEYDNLTQYCNRTAATFTSISDAITFLDTMINYSASADNISSNDIELPIILIRMNSILHTLIWQSIIKIIILTNTIFA